MDHAGLPTERKDRTNDERRKAVQMASQLHDDLAQRGLPAENGACEFGSVKDAAAAIAVSVSFLNKARMGGRGPPYLKFGRMIRYDLAAVRAWARSCERRSTSQQASE
jgi:hypothetical protein